MTECERTKTDKTMGQKKNITRIANKVIKRSITWRKMKEVKRPYRRKLILFALRYKTIITLALIPISKRTGSIKSGESAGTTHEARRNPYSRNRYMINACVLRVLRNGN